MPTQYLGRADDISVVGDENGFELHFSTEDKSYVVNVHGVSRDLLKTVTSEIGSYWAEARAAAREHVPVVALLDAVDAFAAADPKHPNWHSVHADHYDSREGK